MARLEELIAREADPAAKAVFQRLAGQPATPSPQPARRAPIVRTELEPLEALKAEEPARSRGEAVRKAERAGVPHEPAVQAASDATSDDGGFSWQRFVAALPMLLAGPGAFGATLVGMNAMADRRLARNNVRTDVFRELNERARTMGPQRAVLRFWEDPATDALMGQPGALEAAKEWAELTRSGTPTEPPETREVKVGDRIVTQQWNEATRSWDTLADADRFAPPAPAAQISIDQRGETELSIQKARADAQRIYTDLPGLRENYDAQIKNSGAMLQLLEAGTETGHWPDAIKRTIRDRFGIDVGLDPALETFATMAGQQMLSNAKALGSQPTDRDARVIESLTASPGRGREANIAILKARLEVLRRLDLEAKLETEYFERNDNSRAGFREWLQSQDLGPIFSDAAIQAITKPIVESEQRRGQTVMSLAKAIEAADKSAVNAALVALGREGVAALDQNVRDAARAVLEGKGAASPAPEGSRAPQDVKDLLATFGSR